MMNNVQCFVFYSDLPDYQTDLVTGWIFIQTENTL